MGKELGGNGLVGKELGGNGYEGYGMSMKGV